MKISISLILFLFTITTATAQVKFDSLYDFYTLKEGANAIIVEPNNYLVGGFVPDTPSGFQKLGLLSLDLSGNVLYKKSYGSTNTNYYLGLAGSMIKTYDGGYMLGGGTNDINGLQMAMLMKLDANGDSLWTKFYGDSIIDDFFYQIKQTRDSGFIGVGVIDPPGVALADLYIVKTDSLGNLQWQQQYGTPNNYEAAYTVQQYYDGGYIVGANQQNAAGDNIDNYILRLDTAGNLVWPQIYGGPYKECAGIVQIEEADSSILAASCSTRTIIAGVENRVFQISKLDRNGTILWSKDYGSNADYMLITSFEKTFDGNYIAAGQGHPTSTFGPFTQVLGRIFKVSPQGDSLWYRSYYPSATNCNGLCDQNYLRDIKPTPDGGYIACGFVADVFQDMWVIKIDSMGCVDTLCITTGFMEHKPSNIPVAIYPNPAQNACTVKAPLFINAVLSVYDLEGRVLLQQEFNKEAKINVSEFKQGMYFIVLQNTKQRTVSKFIKE